ncbi:MAG: carboxypeptidase-like regulatory domain-containing protein [Terracidiphilus sp.]
MRICSLLLLSAIAVPGLYGQVFELNGGASTLYQAQGGTLSARGANFDASTSAGVIGGAFVGGMTLSRTWGKATLIGGSDYIPFVLPTDVFDTSHFLIGLGAGVQTKVHDADIFAFAGATSNQFDSPFFQGARAQDPAGMLFLKKPLTDHLMLSSNMVFSQQVTAIQGLDWTPKKDFTMSAAAGAGGSQPYGAAAMMFNKPWMDVKAEYVEAGSQFHRVALDAPLTSEPNRENVMVTVRPTNFLSLTGGRNNYLSPVENTQTEVSSQVNSASGALRVLGTGLSATYYHSGFEGATNDATAYTADRKVFSRLQANSSYMESRPSDAPITRSFVTNLTESLTPRLDVSELISRSQGQTTVSFGGGLLSNFVSVTAEYQTYYVPERNSAPFEQAMIVDVTMHLFRGVSLHGGTFVAPDGSLKYTADTHAVTVRQGSGSNPGGMPVDSGLVESSIGNLLLRGRVIDTQGRPVTGAALMIDNLLVYTDDDGFYNLRERKPHDHELKVLTDQFLGVGKYRVVSAPATIKGTYDVNEPDTVIVVERVPEPHN